MAGFDVHSDTTPLNPLRPVSEGPTVGALRAAIAASGVAASYPTATLQGATQNDLVAICRAHSIAVNTVVP